MVDTSVLQLAIEVEVDAVARRAQLLITDKLEELTSAAPFPATSDASSGASTPQVQPVVLSGKQLSACPVKRRARLLVT